MATALEVTATISDNDNKLNNIVPEETCKHQIELRKTSKVRLNPRTEKNIHELMDKALTKRKEKGWHIDIDNPDWKETPDKEDDSYLYRVILNVICDTPKTKVQSDSEFNGIVKAIDMLASKHTMKWEIGLIDGMPPSEIDLKAVQRNVEYVDLKMPENFFEFFRHIFQRDSQIHLVHKALCAAIESEFNNRFHVALIGDPAAGKTEILRSLKKALGEECCLEFDATATTMAGAIKDLDQRDSLPRIMLVEEIEKAEENSLRWLLGVMDQRAEIRKKTNRGTIEKECKMLTFATVNDLPAFLKMNSGALASRFSLKLYCPHLSQDILKRILEREVARVKKANKSWVKYALDYGEKHNIYDPRTLIAICLAGGNDLITEDFQKWLADCDPQDYLEKCLSRK